MLEVCPMSVTVRWNGTLAVQEATEQPDDSQSIGEFCAAFADAHGIDADLHPRFTVEGEDLPADAEIGTLDGTTVFLTVDTPEVEQAEPPALGADGQPVAVVAGDRPSTKTETAAARPLGRHVEHDPASWNFQAERAPAVVSVLHKRTRKAFDQGDLGSCTGNAMAGAICTAPFKHTKVGEATAIQLYELATTLDSTPGSYPPDDTGSSGLAVCKAAQQKKLISAYHHAFGVQHALEALVLAPVIIGIPWYTSFDTPAADGLIAIADGATVRGGHEVELLGIDVDASEVIGINSWGPSWGAKGRFRMSFDTLATLLADQGDCTVPIP